MTWHFPGHNVGVCVFPQNYYCSFSCIVLQKKKNVENCKMTHKIKMVHVKNGGIVSRQETGKLIRQSVPSV